jgi:hypothetical protein
MAEDDNTTYYMAEFRNINGEHFKVVNGVNFKTIDQLNDRNEVTHWWYKCECGVIIKKNTTLHKHTLTKSHEQNLINRHYFAIPRCKIIVISLKTFYLYIKNQIKWRTYRPRYPITKS